jgi:hypothetical protein
MNPVLKIVLEVFLGIVTALTAMMVATAKIKEAKARKKDPTFKPNPKRCEEEREKILVLQGQNKVWAQRFDTVDDGIRELKAGQQKLIDLHLTR